MPAAPALKAGAADFCKGLLLLYQKVANAWIL